MTLISKKLEMIFLTLDDKKVTLSISNPRSDLTRVEVDTVMDTIVTNNIFGFGGVPLKEKYTVRINTIEELE